MMLFTLYLALKRPRNSVSLRRPSGIFSPPKFSSKNGLRCNAPVLGYDIEMYGVCGVDMDSVCPLDEDEKWAQMEMDFGGDLGLDWGTSPHRLHNPSHETINISHCHTPLNSIYPSNGIYTPKYFTTRKEHRKTCSHSRFGTLNRHLLTVCSPSRGTKHPKCAIRKPIDRS